MKKSISMFSTCIAVVSILLFNTHAVAQDKKNIKTVLVNNYPISYTEKGKGEPLLLIHGALTDYRTWLNHLDVFSEYNRTIAVSLRHNYPEKWDGRGNDLGIEQDVKDMAALIKKLNLGKVNLVGHSRGGAVAMLLASKHPNLVKRLILADPAPLFSMLQGDEEALQQLKKRKSVLELSNQYYSANNIDAGLKEFINYIAGQNAWDKTTETRRNALRQNALTLKSLIHDVEIPFNCKDIKKISAPVLLITGERSKPVYGQMNNSVSSCLKNPVKATVADAGHMMYSSNPTAFIFEIQDFVLAD